MSFLKLPQVILMGLNFETHSCWFRLQMFVWFNLLLYLCLRPNVAPWRNFQTLLSEGYHITPCPCHAPLHPFIPLYLLLSIFVNQHFVFYCESYYHQWIWFMFKRPINWSNMPISLVHPSPMSAEAPAHGRQWMIISRMSQWTEQSRAEILTQNHLTPKSMFFPWYHMADLD